MAAEWHHFKRFGSFAAQSVNKDQANSATTRAIQKWYTDLYQWWHPKNHIGKVDGNVPHLIGAAGKELWVTGEWRRLGEAKPANLSQSRPKKGEALRGCLKNAIQAVAVHHSSRNPRGCNRVSGAEGSRVGSRIRRFQVVVFFNVSHSVFEWRNGGERGRHEENAPR